MLHKLFLKKNRRNMKNFKNTFLKKEMKTWIVEKRNLLRNAIISSFLIKNNEE